MNRELIRMEEIYNYYGTKKVLNSAKLNLFQDEIIGIIGINYSGKSTLVGGITGSNPYVSGRTYVSEKEVVITSIEQARQLGIFYVQAESSLIEEFTILENLFLTTKRQRIIINKERLLEESLEIMKLLHIQGEIDDCVQTLSFRNRVLVEIAKAIIYDAKVLVLDNVLNGMSIEAMKEFLKLFEVLRSLHISIILVDNGIKYLKPYCDRLFVMREGRSVAVLEKQEMNEDLVVSLMLGYPFNELAGEVDYQQKVIAKKKLLQFVDVCVDEVLFALNFTLYQGEITGVLNVNKNSGKAIEELLHGKRKIASGNILLNGKEVVFSSPENVMAMGIATVPESDLIFYDLTMEENITLSALKMNSKIWKLNEDELKYISRELLSDYIKNNNDVYITDCAVPENKLIQKKVMFCRALATNPKLIVLGNPTRTIDVTTKNKVYEDILKMKQRGVSVLLISSDAKELFMICDRIVVVNKGRAEKTIQVRDTNKEQLLNTYGKYLKEI